MELQVCGAILGIFDHEPAPVPVPTMDEGPHFSYAVQWFIFSTVAVVGYPLILRKRAAEGAPPHASESPEG